jgi:hypothetical protein
VELSACPFLIKPIFKGFIVHKHLGNIFKKKVPMILGGYHGKK